MLNYVLECDAAPKEHRSRWLRDLAAYPDHLRLRGSVVPDIFPLIVLTMTYGYVIAHAYKWGLEYIAISNSVVPALSVVLGLLLAFRANTSYARYYEGRQLWETLTSHARNLSRLVWLSIPERNQNDHLEKMRCMKLILAFAVATKHHLRHEYGVDYYDLDYLLPPHWIPAATADDNDDNNPNKMVLLPRGYFPQTTNERGMNHHQQQPSEYEWKPQYGGDDPFDKVNRPIHSSESSTIDSSASSVKSSSSKKHHHHHHHHHVFSSDEDLPDDVMLANMSLPLEIIYRVSLYFEQAKTSGKVDAIFSSVMISHMNSLNDCLAGLERLIDTPIPKAYNIHLKQSLWLYLLVMPFTIVADLGWWLIPTVVMNSFILYGIDAIGAQIENPFGYNGNDLPLNEFCDQIRKEIEFIVHHIPCEVL
ncbi:Bestrophin, RFP-TM, chloride channel-domain-containing protein [Halteromyces radiatus]|uniref:Bestrophin, RFP-TM, chloride channel-domain-containing protein n=1 Tax=Halteromyces radiatus TaxID=101107 RepID=UPI00221E82EA|nr:Bestrophin, RFP-TM, chloride channel-domain-containing protein [Halteromyces radiatus]KAI8096370.1 Bestrophin, RFP-TM, chloride channel-domain-containing protein [Halteromyces radiatus]